MKTNMGSGRMFSLALLASGMMMGISAQAQTATTAKATATTAKATTAKTTATTAKATTATATATQAAATTKATTTSAAVKTTATTAAAVATTQTAEAQAKVLTDQMKESLGLSDTQYPLVYAVNLKYLQKGSTTTTKAQTGLNKLKAVQTSANAKESEMKTILTDEQFQKYQSVKDKVKTTAIEKLKKLKF